METKYSDTYVVGFCGKARSGKDTAARHLAEYLDGTVYSMADTLKAMLSVLLMRIAPFPEQAGAYAYSCLYGNLKDETVPLFGKSPREMLQTLGTEWGRGMVDDEIWIKVMKTVIRNTSLPVVCIPDVRFDNEAKMCDLLIQVVRDDVPETVGVEGHASEAGISPEHIDVTIHNNGTIEELKKDVETVWLINKSI